MWTVQRGGGTTAGHVARDFVSSAPSRGCLCRREAGCTRSVSVMTVLRRKLCSRWFYFNHNVDNYNYADKLFWVNDHGIIMLPTVHSEQVYLAHAQWIRFRSACVGVGVARTVPLVQKMATPHFSRAGERSSGSSRRTGEFSIVGVAVHIGL